MEEAPALCFFAGSLKYFTNRKESETMATINSGPNAQKINQQIGALDYRPEEILAFPGSSISSFIPRTGELTPA